MSTRTLSTQGASLTLHALALAVLMLLARPAIQEHGKASVFAGVSHLTVYLPPALGGGGGGGGDRSPTPASKGVLPAFDPEPLAPPQVVIRNPEPELPVTPAILGPVTTVKVNFEALGSPWGAAGPPSNGTGTDGGIGEGDKGGVGNWHGRAAGPGKTGFGLQVYHETDGVTLPLLISKVEPEFSEEARKARYQGTVLLRLIVGADGRVRNAEVIRALGMGLDERALDAVKLWRFRPGTRNGVPVPVEAAVEVTFRLL